MEQTWNIAGHHWAVEHLRRSITTGHVAHAYLFSGPASIGKATLALRFAQALLCERGTGDPCLECRACKRTAHGNHPDVRMMSLAIQAAADKEDTKSRVLGIDTIREWQRDIDLRPFEATRRVFILDDADKLTEQAANAMLKTLEEPPPYAVLILIAQGAGDLLPTVVSRCRVLRLRPLGRGEVAAALQTAYDVTPEDAELLAAWSGGHIGRAMAAAKDRSLLDEQTAILEALAELRVSQGAARLKWAEEQAKEYRAGQAQVHEALTLWQSWWRDVLLTANGCEGAITFIDRRSELRAVAAATPLTSIHAFLRHIEQTREQLAENVNPQLALENLVLHLP